MPLLFVCLQARSVSLDQLGVADVQQRTSLSCSRHTQMNPIAILLRVLQGASAAESAELAESTARCKESSLGLVESLTG